MKNNHFIIKTERLTLRPLTLNDLNTTHEYASDVENTNFMLYLPNETIEDTKAFLTNVANEWKKEISSFYEFAIVFNQKHIGAVSISLDETKQEGELGWIINKAYQRNGYAFEAAQAIIDFAIGTLQK